MISYQYQSIVTISRYGLLFKRWIILNFMNFMPAAFICAAASIFLGQSWKVIKPVLSGKKLNWSAAIQSGGMPSSHTAAVASMTLMIGIRDGFSSSIFSVALIFTFIIAHDAIKVRGTMNTMIRLLERSISKEVLENEARLPETIGHSLIEVIAGFAMAVVIAVLANIVLPG